MAIQLVLAHLDWLFEEKRLEQVGDAGAALINTATAYRAAGDLVRAVAQGRNTLAEKYA